MLSSSLVYIFKLVKFMHNVYTHMPLKPTVLPFMQLLLKEDNQHHTIPSILLHAKKKTVFLSDLTAFNPLFVQFIYIYFVGV